ncbi:MAG: MBL fold metallo-hydrolase, partial [Bacillota bacterium]
MKLTVLGRYGKFPNKDGATCSYLIQSSGGTRIVLDMGSGSLHNLNKILDYKDIDGVIISHFHGDHCADAFVFRNIALELTKTDVWKTKLPFFMPQHPIDEYNALKSCPGFEVVDIHNELKSRIKDLELEFIRVNHPLPTFGVRVIDSEKKVLSYTADIMDKKNLDKLFKGSDFALVDACILQKNHKEGAPHISVKNIAR